MNTEEAILAFAQSEKIKAALISLAQALEMLQGLSYDERRGAEGVLRMLLGGLMQEIGLSRIMTKQKEWDDVESLVDRARVMVESGVGEEAAVHLGKAISAATTVGQRAMSLLKEAGLL